MNANQSDTTKAPLVARPVGRPRTGRKEPQYKTKHFSCELTDQEMGCLRIEAALQGESYRDIAYRLMIAPIVAKHKELFRAAQAKPE